MNKSKVDKCIVYLEVGKRLKKELKDVYLEDKIF